jgi:tRNA (cmo5U34)-methyltransferase
MIMEKDSVAGYDVSRASNYDEESKLDKGNREQHRFFLQDFLKYTADTPKSFLELGCGTAYFTDVFYEMYPHIEGTLLDGSREMLAIAATRYTGKSAKASFVHSLFEEIKWDTLAPSYDLIFSSLSIHHLTDEGKWKIFDEIYDKLSPGGIFILYDVFRPLDQKSVEILEYLACMDSRRRLMTELEVDVDIEELNIQHIVANDRRIKQLEGDKETCLELQKENLRKSGFKNVTTIFQDARFAGTVAFKSRTA